MAKGKPNGAILYEAFKRYYDLAETAERDGSRREAAKMYARSAENLLELAKLTQGETQRMQVEISDKIMHKARKLQKEPDSPPAADAALPAEEIQGKWQPEPVPSLTFDDVAGLEDVKRIVRERVIGPMKSPALYRKMRLSAGTGLMMFGPPGTGKTTIARAIAREVNAPIFVVECASLVSKYLGDAEANVKSLFDTARALPACVLFFDDFEAIAASRDDSHEAIARMVGQLLAEIDGFQKNQNNMLLLAATNKPWKVDDALKRPGRFAEQVYVPLPDDAARAKLYEIELKDLPAAQNLEMQTYVDMSAGFSGGDVKAVCDSAKMSAIRRAIQEKSNDPAILHEDMLKAISACRPSVNEGALERFREYMEENNFPPPDAM